MLIAAGRVVALERLAAICHAHGVEHLELFGSAASDTTGPTSDIDILYTLQPGRTLGWEINDLADELSELFGRPVDLVSRRALHVKLRDHVLAETRPLLQRDLLLLGEMIAAAEQIPQLAADITLDELDERRERRDALLWNNTVLGEAAGQVSNETKARFPTAAWQQPVPTAPKPTS
ncbi:hypothetical protein GCM10009836_48300 [Pseudonocardia ailaonensis]|uniref:Polymerase beta nucleotidyltransferase domain-containing protein n=1 Tax=Pseudonocardia ailaonensis TaxID=367279 RepID=A0ABN2NBY3_9PSEU